MKTVWLCMAHRWAFPTVDCGVRGDGVTGAEKHTKATDHPTFTTTNLAAADALAMTPKDSAA